MFLAQVFNDVSIGDNVTSSAARLAQDIAIAIVILFALVVIRAAINWGKYALMARADTRADDEASREDEERYWAEEANRD